GTAPLGLPPVVGSLTSQRSQGHRSQLQGVDAVKLLPRSRRGRTALAGGLVAALAFAVWCDWYRPWEAHYLGRPTSWWDREAREWLNSAASAGPVALWVRRRPDTPLWREWLGRVTGRPADTAINVDLREEMPLLRGDPAAVPVLAELLRDPDLKCRLIAAEG